MLSYCDCKVAISSFEPPLHEILPVAINAIAAKDTTHFFSFMIK